MGFFYNYAQFKEKYGIHCNYLEFYSIISAIPVQWKQVAKTPNVMKVNYQEELILEIIKVDKVCKFIHQKCVDKLFKVPISQEKWNTILLQPVVDWKKIYIIPFKSTMCTKLRYFQYKIMQNILGVNQLLKKIGISDSDLCTFCSTEKETLLHLFWECPFTRHFVREFERQVLNNEVILNMNEFIFGIPDGYFRSVNFVILYAKYYIFTTRCNKGTLNISSFKKFLKHYYEVEQTIYSKQGKFVLFVDRWRHVQLI